MKATDHLRTVMTVAVLLFIVVFGDAAKGADKWKPNRTWVFFVGLVKWQDEEEFEPFTADIRKDGTFLESIRKQGVPRDHVIFMQDTAATTAAVGTRFADLLKRTQPGDWLIVYFEGHGYKDEHDTPYLVTYDVAGKIKGWPFKSIPAQIENYFKGEHAIIALDNCYAGAMVDEVQAQKKRVAYAVLASSIASQESTQNWTFTEALINGFNGESFVDTDRDGAVTIRELGHNAEKDMIFGEKQLASIAFINGFDPETVMVPAVPAPKSPRIGDRVEAYTENDWFRGYIADTRRSRYKVHFYGYEKSDELWLPARAIRKPISYSRFKPGDKVEVRYKGRWRPAHVLNIKGGSHYVTYDEYDIDENEWVPPSRIRKAR
jgi:hypothetical protein